MAASISLGCRTFRSHALLHLAQGRDLYLRSRTEIESLRWIKAMSLLLVTVLATIPLVKGNNGCLCNLFASPEDRVTQIATFGVDSLGVSLYDEKHSLGVSDKKRTCGKTPSQLGAAPGTPTNKYKVHYRP